MDDFGYYVGITPAAAGATVVSTILLYAVFAAVLRWWGQRIFASPSSLDLAIVIVLGAVVGRATLGMTPTVSGALIALGTLFACEFVVRRVRRHRPAPRKRHRAVAVLVGGHVEVDTLRRLNVAEATLWGAMRGAGIRSPSEVALVVLEPNGRFSFLRAGEPIHDALLTGVKDSQEIRVRLQRGGTHQASA